MDEVLDLPVGLNARYRVNPNLAVVAVLDASSPIDDAQDLTGTSRVSPQFGRQSVSVASVSSSSGSWAGKRGYVADYQFELHAPCRAAASYDASNRWCGLPPAASGRTYA